MSIAGGLGRAIERGEAAGCETIQIFTKSANQWRARHLGDDEIAAFTHAAASSPLSPIVAHGSYLINLASPVPELLERSRTAFLAEMLRAEALGIPLLVIHPGAHTGSGEASGLDTVAASLNRVHRDAPGLGLRVLLETTAGQGTCLGARFNELAQIIDRVDEPERLGICLDTCHVHAAGYNLITPEGYEATLCELDRTAGLDRLAVIHLNDSKTGLGSRVDRHEHIGHGTLGLEPFQRLLHDPRLEQVPMILETPKGPGGRGGTDLEADRDNLAVLRGLLADGQP